MSPPNPASGIANRVVCGAFLCTQGSLAMDGGGAAMNQAIHTVDLLIWLAQAAMPELATPEHDESNPVAEVSCCEPSVMRA